MDIRKFFGVISSGKKPVSESVKKNEKVKPSEGTVKGKKGAKEVKANNSSKEDVSKPKPHKRKRIIYDSDSESEETVQVKNAKKKSEKSEKLPLSSKPGKISRKDPVTYISETDEDDDFVCKKAASKSKENGVSANSHRGASTAKKNEETTKTKNKPLSPIKLTPTSVLDYFGTESVQRSGKKMVASRRKESSQNMDDSRLNDEAIAKQLQLDEDAELERQLHEDEEFARTLAMLDEEPKTKKARKDPEEGESFSPVQADISKAENHKSPDKEHFLNERKPGSPAQPSRGGCSRGSAQPCRSSARQSEACSSPKASSKLALMKAKEERSYKDTELTASKRKENAIELKGEKQTPKKTKSSPAKKEVGTLQGDQSCANKLLRWLRNWHQSSPGEKKHAKFGKLSSKDDGSSFKAALLSGPPGVGKTTTASLVCQVGAVEWSKLNASDTRSKNSLKAVVAESLNNTSIKGFYTSGTTPSVSSKHALIMDEVDGMAGSEDRGGIQELIGLIKHTKIPIICMCNDRNHPKIRSLVMSMWCAQSKALTYDQAKADSQRAKKDIKLGPFDVARKVFAAGEETAHMSLMDKSDLFFHDYSIAPLFVQENYLHVKPVAAGGDMKKHLMLISRAADSICDGDLVDSQIRSKQNWSLLPTQAIYASVLPGELMRGYMTQFPSFPSWLGKYSSTGKHDRIVQDLALHMSLRTYSSKRTVNMDYLSHIRDALVRPLASQGVEGVQHVVTLMDTYYLMREDFENIMEVSSWGGQPSPFSRLDPKVKAAFTRAYNKEVHLTPYSLQVVKTLRLSTVQETALDGAHLSSRSESVSSALPPLKALRGGVVGALGAAVETCDLAFLIKLWAKIMLSFRLPTVCVISPPQKKTRSSKPSKPEKDKESKRGKGRSWKK
nr:replication factor C subunit 1 [Peromyscus maniculatus bairdii]